MYFLETQTHSFAQQQTPLSSPISDKLKKPKQTQPKSSCATDTQYDWLEHWHHLSVSNQYCSYSAKITEHLLLHPTYVMSPCYPYKIILLIADGEKGAEKEVMVKLIPKVLGNMDKN